MERVFFVFFVDWLALVGHFAALEICLLDKELAGGSEAKSTLFSFFKTRQPLHLIPTTPPNRAPTYRPSLFPVIHQAYRHVCSQLARYNASEAGIRAREKADFERRYAAKAAELDSNIHLVLVTNLLACAASVMHKNSR